MSRTGRPSRSDKIAADDLLIDELATATLHGDVTVDDGRRGELARLLMTLHCLAECPPGADGYGKALDPRARKALAGFVEARSCLDVVISTMIFEDPATPGSALADRIPAQCGSGDHNVSAAIAAAIEALDVAFEDWQDNVAGATAVTDVEPPLPAVPAARVLGGGVPPAVMSCRPALHGGSQHGARTGRRRAGGASAC